MNRMIKRLPFLVFAAAVMLTPALAMAEAPAGKKGVFSLVLDNVDFVFVIIMICSVIGVALIIQSVIRMRESVLMPAASIEAMKDMINNKQFKELLEFTENDPSFVARAMNPALKRAPSFSSMREALETAVGEQTAEQFRRLEYLNILGNLGPLLGLLGTVLGMIEAFQAMSAGGGKAGPEELAGGISKALAHTMLGLGLAIPCLAAFGVLRTFVDRITVKAALTAEELLLMIKPAEAGVRPAVAARPVVRPATPPAPPAAPVATPAATPPTPPTEA